MDGDDVVSLRATEGYLRVVNPPLGEVSAVRNWNAAAVSARGRVLLVIADDLLPPNGWDGLLRGIIARADPEVIQWVVISREEGAGNLTLIRHPVLSCAHFRRYGLFDPAFRGVYCDDDFTLRAFKHSLVLNCPSLIYTHRHPGMGTLYERTTSHEAMNKKEEYEYGKAVFEQSWPRWRRLAVGRYPYPDGWPVGRIGCLTRVWRFASLMLSIQAHTRRIVPYFLSRARDRVKIFG